ncbi:unnamed protein product [Penicillium discolor]
MPSLYSSSGRKVLISMGNAHVMKKGRETGQTSALRQKVSLSKCKLQPTLDSCFYMHWPTCTVNNKERYNDGQLTGLAWARCAKSLISAPIDDTIAVENLPMKKQRVSDSWCRDGSCDRERQIGETDNPSRRSC